MVKKLKLFYFRGFQEIINGNDKYEKLKCLLQIPQA